MKEITLNKHKVIYYDDIEQLPAVRHQKYNKMILIDAGLGPDIEMFDSHFDKAIAYMNNNNTDLAVKQLDNIRHAVYMVQNEMSPKYMAFAALIKSIDGVDADDLSDDGLKKTFDIIKDTPISDVNNVLDSVKKKIDEQLQMYFPKMFDDSRMKEYYTKLIRRTLMMLDGIINDFTDELQRKIDKIDNLILMMNKPAEFSGPESFEIQFDKDFETMCVIISQHLHIDPKKKTVMEFYTACERVKDDLEQKKKAQKRNDARRRN